MSRVGEVYQEEEACQKTGVPSLAKNKHQPVLHFLLLKTIHFTTPDTRRAKMWLTADKFAILIFNGVSCPFYGSNFLIPFIAHTSIKFLIAYLWLGHGSSSLSVETQRSRPSHLHQPIQEDTEVFPGQLRHIIPPACSPYWASSH